MRWRLLHLVLLLAVWPTALAGAGMDVALQVTLANPAVEAPVGLALTEGALLGAPAAADGTAVLVTLPPGAFVGARLDLLLTAPGGTVTTISMTLGAADLLAGTVRIDIGPTLLLMDGRYGIEAVMRAPDATVSLATSGPSFQVERAPPPAVGIASIVGDGVLIPPDGTTHDRRPRVSGTATPGSTVRVLANGERIGSARAATDGAWSVAPAADLDLHWQTFTARATLAGISADSAGYAVDILGEERDVEVDACGIGSWVALILVLTAALGLRSGRRSLGVLLALLPLADARAAERVDETRGAISLAAVAWPAGDASRSTRDGEEIEHVSDPSATVRFDLSWWTGRVRPGLQPALGFSVGYWRSACDLAPARPADASFHVNQANLPFSAQLRWRPIERGGWGCDAQLSAGLGPVFAQVRGSSPAGEFPDQFGVGSVLDGSIAVEPWCRISDDWILGASLRGVVAWTDVRFEDRAPNEASDHYRAVQRVHGIAWGAFAAWSW